MNLNFPFCFAGTNTVLKSVDLQKDDVVLMTSHTYLAVRNTVEELQQTKGSDLKLSLVIASTFFLVAQLYIFLVVASSMFLWHSLMQSHPVPCVWSCHEWVFLLLWYVMWNIYVLFSFSFLSIFCSRPCKTFLSN